MVYMGLLNKNEKTSNIFFEDVKSVISKIARLIYRNGFVPYDDWKNIDESLTPILGPSMYGLPKNAGILVFKRSWTGCLCSIYIIDKPEEGERPTISTLVLNTVVVLKDISQGYPSPGQKI